MERNKGKRKRIRRQRLNALLPHEDVLEMCSLTREERAARNAARRQDCVCAPASYQIMEELIKDPVNEEKERRRKALEKWTEETHKQFAQRLVQHGKDFRKIAESLPNKTVADCVEHYYMTKHCPNFKALKAKAQAETQGGSVGHTEPERTSLREDKAASSTSEPQQLWSDKGLQFEAEDDCYFQFRD